MSTTGLPAFDDTVHATNVWLHEIMSRLGWEDRHKAYRLMRTALHMIRDRLPVTEAAQLAAQLPMLMRGIYYEGWRPSAVPVKVRHADEFLEPLREAFSQEPDFDAETAFREFVAVMRRHISEGEFEDVYQSMPHDIRRLWEERKAA